MTEVIHREGGGRQGCVNSVLWGIFGAEKAGGDMVPMVVHVGVAIEGDRGRAMPMRRSGIC